ncbi:MAG: hypothetical protein K8T90_06115 [Planctomycetes bacterium]|nr:hypothetical protein [Planctomycetota bacterium]
MNDRPSDGIDDGVTGDINGGPGDGAACSIAARRGNITDKGRTRRMVAGVVVALLAAGLFVGVDAHITDGSLGRWWRIGLVPLIFFSALCVFQAQERT